jgi:hypothetical protein
MSELIKNNKINVNSKNVKDLNLQFIKTQAINKTFEDLDINTFIEKSNKWICQIIKSSDNQSDNQSDKQVKVKKSLDDNEIIGADQNDNFLRFIPPYNYTCTAGDNCSKPAAFKSKLDSNCYCWLHIHSVNG